MRIDSTNKELIKEIYLHDATFTGFTYDYKTRQILLNCKNGFSDKYHEFVFNDVVSSTLQSCELWYPSPHVYYMWTKEESPAMENLRELQAKEGNSLTRLGGNTEYIIVMIQLISGDTLEIICESVDHTETALEARQI